MGYVGREKIKDILKILEKLKNTEITLFENVTGSRTVIEVYRIGNWIVKSSTSAQEQVEAKFKDNKC